MIITQVLDLMCTLVRALLQSNIQGAPDDRGAAVGVILGDGGLPEKA